MGGERHSIDYKISQAAAIIRNGGLVVFPTETVYGVGANALNPEACARIFSVKGRPRFNPLIVHFADAEHVRDLAEFFPDAEKLAQQFWPGPLTLVLPKKARLDGIVTGDLETVGVRVPGHPIARELILEAGVPIAAPSANRFMALSPTTLEHARHALGNSVDFYLDGGPSNVGVESTIIGWIDGHATLLRPGGLDPSAIESVIGPLKAPLFHEKKPLAPGMLSRHYAPTCPLYLEDHTPQDVKFTSLALICLKAAPSDYKYFNKIFELAPDGDLIKAAARLYSILHLADQSGTSALIVRLVPNKSLGITINDRLRRAAAQQQADSMTKL